MGWQHPTGRETSGLRGGESPAVILLGPGLVRRVSQGAVGRAAGAVGAGTGSEGGAGGDTGTGSEG